MEVPSNLTLDASEIRIYSAAGKYYNRTADSIVIAGNRHGFLSLANSLIYLVNSLVDEIHLAEIPYVRSDVFLTIHLDESVDGVSYGLVSKVSEAGFVWQLSESQSNDVFTAMHSLGHLNSELHFDDGKAEEELSVYCVVVDESTQTTS